MSSPEGKREFEKLARGWIRMAELAELEEGMRRRQDTGAARAHVPAGAQRNR